jgi:hypothetical protein
MKLPPPTCCVWLNLDDEGKSVCGRPAVKAVDEDRETAFYFCEEHRDALTSPGRERPVGPQDAGRSSPKLV